MIRKKEDGFYNVYIKRGLDAVFSCVLLMILWPVMLVIMGAIRLDSKGPAIFVQDRLSLNGHVFKMLKFRTMIVNAEQQGTGAYSFDNDPRITRVGKILRKLSLDELPQLINILKGEMSFVGPRPILTYHPCKYDEYTDEEKRVFLVRPGITGWAQVNGRNTVKWTKRFELNLWYVENVSFWLDIQIIAKTFLQVFTTKETIITEKTAEEFRIKHGVDENDI